MPELNSSLPWRVIVPCPDWPQAAGGVRKLYRHVDVLNANGLRATILHQEPGFRCTWFENSTAVAYRDDIWPPRDTDILLVPEGISWQMLAAAPDVPKVIFNQNAYQTFVEAGDSISDADPPPRHPSILATIVVSEDSREYLNHVFPGHPIYRIRNSIDPELFHCRDSKRPRIVFMPRKKKSDAIQIINMLRYRKALHGFEVMPIMNKSETETAQLLRESVVFMSLCTYEGSPMPPLEAMASGCITVGYHGRGGAEYLNEGLAFPVEAEDVLGFARRMEKILAQLRENPAPLLDKAKLASDFIRTTYTPQREQRDILRAWSQILQRMPARPHS